MLQIIDLFKNQYFKSNIMTFALYLISFEIFNNHYISWMCLILRFADTWRSQGESFTDNAQV